MCVCVCVLCILGEVQKFASTPKATVKFQLILWYLNPTSTIWCQHVL